MRFDFGDINLVPRYSTVDSRSECDTSIKFGNYTFNNPVIPANMESVINEELAVKLAKEGYFYIMHRFGIDNIQFVKNMHERHLIASISIGVNDESYQQIKDMVEQDIKPEYITIDIAHGHCKKMKKMIKFVKEKMPTVFLIAGNVSTIDATRDLDNWGADAVKVGVGPGCFEPTSKVITKDGLKQLKDIKEGDLVLTHSNSYKEVLQVHTYTDKDTLIKVNDLPMCTPNHEFYVIDKDEKELVTETNLDEYAYWVEASELNKEKHLLIKL